MIRALIRFLFFEMPTAFLSGLVYIIFEKQEITEVTFVIRRLRDKNFKRKILENYLAACHKQVFEEEEKENKNDKKE